MVVDGEGMDETTEAQWKRTGRIVDGALPLCEDGNFVKMPEFMPTTDESGTNGIAPNTPYTVVPDVVTRGRGPPTHPSANGTWTTSHGVGAGGTKRPESSDGLPTDVRAWKAARLEERNRRLSGVSEAATA